MFDYFTLWDKDMSMIIIQENIREMNIELGKGWNINEPLKKYAFQSILKFPIMLAIQNNCYHSVEWLIKHGAKLDLHGEHAFWHALKYSSIEMIEFVVQKGAKIRDKDIDYWPYKLVYDKKKYELIPILMKLGCDINPFAFKAILSAVHDNDLEAISVFLNYGFDINTKKRTEFNLSSNTLLCDASIYSEQIIIQYLLDKGADSLICNKNGLRPYDLALQNGKFENARLLRRLYDPNNDMQLKAVEKLPDDIIEFLEKGLKRVMLKKDDIQFIEFLSISDVVICKFKRRNGVLLTREIDNFQHICLLWNFTRKCVGYYDFEHDEYGEFRVSFTEFIQNPERYIDGVFWGEFVMDILND